jgi:acyl-CoA oxidase
MALASLKLAGVVGFLYSQKRKVVEHHSGRMQPILSFQSQKIPVMTALAQAVVLDPFRDWSIRTFMSTSDPAVRQSIAAIAKVIINTLTHSGLLAVGDRCGAQGLFEVNQLSVCFVSDCALLDHANAHRSSQSERPARASHS